MGVGSADQPWLSTSPWSPLPTPTAHALPADSAVTAFSVPLAWFGSGTATTVQVEPS
jgi:hypothetical protein